MSRSGSIGGSIVAYERSFSGRYNKGHHALEDGSTSPLLRKKEYEGVPSKASPCTGKTKYDGGLFKRILHDRQYRSNLVKTFWIWFCFVIFGWTYSQIGTTLPDLQLVLDINLDLASWLFSTFSIGYLIGCLMGGLLVGRFNTFLLLGLYCLFGTALIIVLPWSDIFGLTLAIRLAHGICIGGMDTTGHAETFIIWKMDSGVYILILYLSFALGGMFSPFANEPFLAKLLHYPNDTVVVSHNSTENVSEVTNSSTSTEGGAVYGETRIHIAYLISGVITFISCVACFVVFAKSRKTKRHGTSAHDLDGIDLRKKPSKAIFVLALGIMSSIFFIVTGFVDNFAGFLMSFTLYQLQWTKTTGALATSMFWVAYAVGNVFCIFLVLHMRTDRIVYVYISFAIGGLIGLLCSCLYQVDALVWVFIFMIGFSMSSLWPSFFTWTEENITQVTGPVSSLYLVSGSVGLFLNPLAIGYMMDLYSPMWFVYIMLMEGVAVMALFTAVVLVYRNVKLPEQVVDRVVT